MKKKIHLPLSILIILALIISIGCGGANNGITPSSLPDTTGNNNTIEGGSIKVTVVWPQPGVEGKCLFTSGENTITTSMPTDAKAILVTVRSDENNKDNILKEYKTQWHLFEWEVGEEATEETAILSPIPAVKVMVRAVAFTKVDSILPNSSDPNAPPTIIPNITLQAEIGTVWFDDFRVYDLHNVPLNPAFYPPPAGREEE